MLLLLLSELPHSSLAQLNGALPASQPAGQAEQPAQPSQPCLAARAAEAEFLIALGVSHSSPDLPLLCYRRLMSGGKPCLN